MTPKERKADLEKKLREAAQLQDPLAKAAIELVKLTGDSLKESLVNAAEEDMLRIQGAAREFARLHKELTTTPPSIVAPTNQE